VSSGLRQRVWTALLLAALVLVILLWLPARVAVGAVMIVVVAGAWEWAGLARLRSGGARLAYAAAVGLAVGVLWVLSESATVLIVLLAAAGLWWFVAWVWLAIAPGWGGRAAAAGAGFAVLVPAAVGVGKLVSLEPGGQVLLLFLLVLVAAADVGAYFGGRLLGRRKLAPRVSPNKTWEGLYAGMAAALVAAVAGGLLFGEPLSRWLPVCLATAGVSVVGDLLESMFKRQAGLKDSSSLLPGHGGVLDRLDSITAAGPVFLLGLLLMGLRG
jgi:phosphatidate cytidylyltransferase